MKRPLILLAAVCAALFFADSLLERRDSIRRVRDSIGVPISRTVTAAQVARLEIAQPPLAWRYVLQDGLWRSVEFRGAYIQPDTMKALLDGLLPGQGTVVSTRKQDLEHYGFSQGRLLLLRLSDAAGAKLMELAVGRSVPGAAAGESYVHVSGTKEVVLLRFNPRAVAAPAPGSKAPPMIDPLVLPKAFPRRGLSHIAFLGQAKYPIQDLQMVMLSTGPPKMPVKGEESKPTFEWRARTAAGTRVLDPGNAGSYAAYLERLSYIDILPADSPAVKEFKTLRGSLLISDDAGSNDRLDLGGDIEGGGTLVRNQRAGLVYVIDSRKLPLFFPPLAALAGKEPLAPIFYRAEPPPGAAPDPSAEQPK